MRASLHIFFVLFCACAKVGAPKGGPVDETEPRIVAHTPAADTTQVPLDAVVEIVFSERMDRRRTEEAVFVAPETAMRRRWRGDRLRLELDLQADRTYVVTVGTDARDQRGNALKHSFTFAFATGPQLNQGRLKGRVFKEHKPAATAHVWAYDLANLDGVLGRQSPDYRTQSGQDGRYEFSRLSAGRYRIVAFADQNRNKQYDEGEWLALPAGDVVAAEDGEVVVGDLLLVEHAPAAPAVRRVQAVHERQILLLFDRPVEAPQLWVEVEGLEVAQVYGSSEDPEKVYLITGPQEPGREYAFTSLELAGRSLEWNESVRGSGRGDKVAPTLAERRPQRQMAAGDTLKFFFSEAMQRQEPAAFWEESDSTWSPTGHWQWLEPALLAFVPSTSLAPGVYKLAGKGAALRDLAGNALEDSVIAFELQVLDADELAAVEGEVVDGRGTVLSAVRVTALHLRSAHSYGAHTDGQGRYTLADLLPGEYAVFAFVDENLNGVRDPGKLDPFEAAESYARYAEELTLKASETERIALNFAQ